jgi:hypothetical protein
MWTFKMWAIRALLGLGLGLVASESPDMTSFRRWFDAGGGYFHPHIVQVGSRMMATGNIVKGEVLFRVPDKLIVALCDLDAGISAERCEEMLVRWILEFRASEAEQTFWAPFLRLLPQGCKSPLCSEAPNFQLHSLGFQKHVVDETPKGMSYEELQVLSVVRSYRWGIQSKYNDQMLTRLVPGAHLFNHDADRGGTCGDLVDELGRKLSEFGAVAKIDYEAGDEVFINYFEEGRPHGSATMLFLYGFLPETVEYDTCHDVLHLRRKEHHLEDKVKCIMGVGQGVVAEGGVGVEEGRGIVAMLRAEMEVAAEVGDEAWSIAGPKAIEMIETMSSSDIKEL